MESKLFVPSDSDREEECYTSSLIKNVKALLISRDKVKISEGVGLLEGLMNGEDAVEQLLRSDVSEFLCDAMAPFDNYNISKIYTCLSKMAEHRSFFTQCHTSFTVDCIIRSAQFHMEDDSRSEFLCQTLKLLAVIFQGYETCEVEPDKKSLENITQLMPALLGKILNDSILFAFTLLIRNLLLPKILQLKKYHIKTFFECLNTCFCRQNDTDSQRLLLATEDFLHLNCDISVRVLKLLKTKDFRDEESTVCFTTLKEELAKSIARFLVKYGAPYISELTSDDNEMDCGKWEIFFQALLYIYHENMPPQAEMSQELSSAGFLFVITKWISLAGQRKKKNLQELCLLVLSNIIVSLSCDVFSLPLLWSEGKETFQKEIRKGFFLLPGNTAQWLDVLTDPDSQRCSKLALIVYLYFYSLTAKNADVTRTIYSAVASFLIDNNDFGSSVLITKTVWFIYVISQLSEDHTNSEDTYSEALTEMLHLLEQHDDCQLVYTHHPVILYWAFSSTRISKEIQSKVVRLWLQNKAANCRELEELMKKCCDIRLAVLEEAISGSEDVSKSAFSSLKTLMKTCEDENLSSAIWFALPEVLAKYTISKATEHENVHCMIELANFKVPKDLNITLMVRTAGLLSRITTSFPITTAVIEIVSKLLEQSIELEDYRVANAYSRQLKFLQMIVNELNSDSNERIALSLRIVSRLWNCENEITKSQISSPTIISIDRILILLAERDTDILSPLLDLWSEIMKSSFKSNIYRLKKGSCSNIVRILFNRIQNICVKNIQNIASKCWTIMRYCLLIKSNDTETVIAHLSSNPWTHEVIRMGLLNYNESAEMKDFLLLWFNRNLKMNVHSDRNISSSYFARTSNRIAEALLDKYSPYWKEMLEALLQDGSPISEHNHQSLLSLWNIK